MFPTAGADSFTVDVGLAPVFAKATLRFRPLARIHLLSTWLATAAHCVPDLVSDR